MESYEFGLVPADRPDAPLSGELQADCPPGDLLMPPGFAERIPSAVFGARAMAGDPLPPGEYLALLRPRDDIPQVSTPLTITAT